MLRQLLSRYLEARRAHPRLTDYAWGAVAYGSTFLVEWALAGIDSWTDYLLPLAAAVAIVSLRRSHRRDREEQ